MHYRRYNVGFRHISNLIQILFLYAENIIIFFQIWEKWNIWSRSTKNKWNEIHDLISHFEKHLCIFRPTRHCDIQNSSYHFCSDDNFLYDSIFIRLYMYICILASFNTSSYTGHTSIQSPYLENGCSPSRR